MSRESFRAYILNLIILETRMHGVDAPWMDSEDYFPIDLKVQILEIIWKIIKKSVIQ